MADYSRMVKGALAAAAGGAGMTMLPDDAEAIFGGRFAKTANLKALQEAQAMKQAGRGRDPIWYETGWFQGPDGKWRFELSDASSRFKTRPQDFPLMSLSGKGPDIEDIINAGRTPIDQRLVHSGLFKAYPELRDITFVGLPGHRTMGAVTGETSAGRPFIGLPEPNVYRIQSPDYIRSGILHELQHQVQDIEGFATGGMPRTPSVVRRTAEEAGLPPSTTTFDDLVRLFGSDKEMYLNYRKLAGETEARNVQTRMNFGPGRQVAPWATQDVPTLEQAIVMPEAYQPSLFPKYLPRRPRPGY